MNLVQIINFCSFSLRNTVEDGGRLPLLDMSFSAVSMSADRLEVMSFSKPHMVIFSQNILSCCIRMCCLFSDNQLRSRFKEKSC